MKALTLICLLAVATMACAQPGPDTLWTRTYGWEIDQEAYAICEAPDGGFVLAGRTRGPEQMLAVRTDSQGHAIWSRVIDGLSADARAIQRYSNGDYLLAGSTVVDFCAARLDSVGDTIWTRTYPRSDGGELYCAVVTADNGALLVGRNIWGSGRMVAIRVNDHGDTLWQRTYSDFTGTAETGAFCGTLLSDGGFALAGYIEGPVYPYADIFVVRITSAGDTMWTRKYGTTEDDIAYSIRAIPDGGLVIAADWSATAMDLVYLIRTDSNGDTLWTHIYPETHPVMPYEMCFGHGGGFVIVGQMVNVSPTELSQMYALRVDDDGNRLWSRRYHRSIDDNGACVLPTNDGGYAFGGYTYNPSFGHDMYLVKTRPDPNEADGPDILHPSSLILSAFPNPFNPQTEITFSLPRQQKATLKVFDVLGREVAELFDGPASAGEHQVTFNGAELPSGIYFARLEAGEMMRMRKMVLMR